MLDMGKNLKRGDNVTALTYTGGPAEGTYLRLTALDLFDGNTWRISPRQGGRKITGNDDLTSPPGFSGDLSKVSTSKMQIDVCRIFRSQFAPVPYPVRSISLKNRWQYDASALDVVSTNGQVVGGQNYNLTTYNLQPTAQQLHDASDAGGEPDQYTSDVPPRTDPKIRKLANDVTAGAQGNDFEKAAALQNFFRTSGGFIYSTENDSGSGMRALSDFLLTNKSGYCEQFATGMALMARILGIPSRVGIGFLPGQPGKDGQHIVRMHDMHAWPELYFQGYGWVRFEPTPSSRVANTPSWTDSTGVTTNTPTTAPTTATDHAGRFGDPRHQQAARPARPTGRPPASSRSTPATGSATAAARRSVSRSA